MANTQEGSMMKWFGIVLVLALAMAGYLSGGWAVAAPAVYVDSAGHRVHFDTAHPGRLAMPDAAPAPQPKARRITFNVYYDDVIDATGVGFDDAAADPDHGTRGEALQSVVSDVLDYLDAVLNEDGVCDIVFEASMDDPDDYTLGGCGTQYFVLPGFQAGFAWQHITTGRDPAASVADIFAQFNFGHAWYAGTGVPTEDQEDFPSTMLHELTHGLGLLSLADKYGQSEGNVFTTFDRFLRTGNGIVLWRGHPPAFHGVSTDLLGHDGGVYFHGPNAVYVFAAPLPIYAPDPYEEGSSISHWAPEFCPPETVMLPVSSDTLTRAWLDFEAATLKDIGYAHIAVGLSDGEGEGELAEGEGENEPTEGEGEGEFFEGEGEGEFFEGDDEDDEDLGCFGGK